MTCSTTIVATGVANIHEHAFAAQGSCGVILLDENGNSVDDLYEIIDGVVYEREAPLDLTLERPTTLVVHKRDPHDVYIGRGSIYGNPFSFEAQGSSYNVIQTVSREEAISNYEKWLLGELEAPGWTRPTQAQVLELQGKRLGCYCAPKPCHGDILAKLADNGFPVAQALDNSAVLAEQSQPNPVSAQPNPAPALIIDDPGTVYFPIAKTTVLPRQTRGVKDFFVSLTGENPFANYDETINAIFDKAGVPKLGGASGTLGWSSFQLFQRCPYLWRKSIVDGIRGDETKAIVIGSAIHMFLALHYHKMIEKDYPLDPKTVFDALIKENCNPDWVGEAWRLFDLYLIHYMNEPITPLAVEYLAVDPKTGESCRYDLIAKFDRTDRGFPPGTFWFDHKCVTGATKVWDFDTNKYWTVEELFKYGHSPRLHAFSETTLKLIPAKATVYPEEVRSVYQITLDTGAQVRVSGNHPILTSNGWIDADKLKPKDWVATPSTLQYGEFESAFSDDELWLIGHMLSEGSFSTLTWTQKKGETWNAFVDVCHRLGADFIEHQGSPRAELDGERVPFITFSTKKGTRVRALFDKLKLTNLTSHDLFIPDQVKAIPDSQVGVLLGALWDGDGAVEAIQKHRLAATLRYTSTSKTLANDVRILLNRLGIPASVSSQTTTCNSKPYVSYKTTVVTREGKRKFLAGILAGKIRAPRLMSTAAEVQKAVAAGDDTWIPVSWISDEMSHVRQDFPQASSLLALLKKQPHLSTSRDVADRWGSEVRRRTNAEIYWSQVQTVEVHSPERMYDIHVPGVHTFIANDVITHNTCPRIDEIARDGWRGDGEIIGQGMLWHRLKLDKKFGEVRGCVINLIPKTEEPAFTRVAVNVMPWQIKAHQRDLQQWQALRNLFISMDTFPRSRGNCIGRYGKCPLWNHCADSDRDI